MAALPSQITATSAAWVNLGFGPMEVAVVSSGAVRVATGATAPATATEGQAIDPAVPGMGSVTIQDAVRVWARGVSANETIRVLADEHGSPVNPVSTVDGLHIPAHDYVGLTYTGANLTGVTYKRGGASGVTVGSLTLGYDGSGNLTSVNRG